MRTYKALARVIYLEYSQLLWMDDFGSGGEILDSVDVSDTCDYIRNMLMAVEYPPTLLR